MARTPKAEAPVDARNNILNAAEMLFGEHGYDGASVREVAAAAGMTVGLLTYYYPSKNSLYEATVERRAPLVGAHRLALLEEERQRFAPQAIPIERIIYCYAWPFLSRLLEGADEGWKSYTKLISGVANSRRWAALVGKYYDPVAQLFLVEMRHSLPDSDEEHVINGFTFFVSAMLGVAAETGRANRLAQGSAIPLDIEHVVGQMITFLAAGFRAGVEARSSSRAVAAN